MFTDKLREWVRARPRPLRVSLVEAWNTAGVRVGEPDGQPVIRLGRAAAVLRCDGRVETTNFMRQDPLSQSMLEGLGEAAWGSAGGAVFNERSSTGDASPLDSAGMYAAAGGWSDIMGMLRLRLIAWEEQVGLLPFLEDAPTRSASYGLPAPRGRRIEATLVHELTNLLSEEFTSAAAIALAGWRQRMPERLLLAMDDAGWNSPDKWNWLVTDLRQPQPRRLQAIEAFPWAAKTIRSKAILLTVDKGQPLAEALAGTHGVSATVIKKLRGMPFSEIAPLKLALELAAQGASQKYAIPRTRSGWACWGVAAVAANRRAMPIGGGDWDALEAPRFFRAMENVDDAARDLAFTLLRPLNTLLGPLLPGPEALETDSIWASPQRAIEAVEAWMRDDGNARRCLIRDWPYQKYYPAKEPWHALHKQWDSGYGLRAKLLVDEDQLEEESIRMGNCVRDYGRRCRLSGVHIVSWRDGAGTSVATQELDQISVLKLVGTRTEAFTASRGLPPGTGQLLGVKNLRAPDKAFLASWAHASALATGALPVEVTFLRDALELRQRHSSDPEYMDTAGWDSSAPGAARAGLRAYSPMLPKKTIEIIERAMRNYEGLRLLPVT